MHPHTCTDIHSGIALILNTIAGNILAYHAMAEVNTITITVTL
jgi:hypothetical protein